MTEMTDIKSIPQAPLTLTILGAIPVWILILLPKAFFTEIAFPVFIYAALIVSFLGGINWGLSLLHKNRFFLWSVIPCIFIWFVTWMYFINERIDNVFYYWVFLLIALLVQFGIDYFIAEQDEKLNWTRLQRLIGTVLIGLPVLVVIFRLAV
ncbi:MAG: DUF3429 domain-containing protein [Pseudomonadota bacterium]